MSVDLYKKKYLKAEALSLVRQSATNPDLLDDSIGKYRSYLGINPSDDDAWAGLGGAYRRKNQINEALDSYYKAYEINSQSTYALVNVISLRAARNNKEDQEKLKTEIPEAIQLCQQAIKKNTEDFWTWYDLATLHLIEGKTSEAISNFNYAIRLTPETAKENFRSVLNNLNFLHKHNPNIKGMQTVIEMINQHFQSRALDVYQVKPERGKIMSEDFKYLLDRLDAQAQWHSAKGALNKRRFYASEIIALVAGALIPIINVISVTSTYWQSWQRVGSTLLASIIVIAAGVGKLINFRENWLSYRGLAEELKREKEFYLNGVGDYEYRQEPDRRRLLVRRTEEILSSTTTRFISVHRSDREKSQDVPKIGA